MVRRTSIALPVVLALLLAACAAAATPTPTAAPTQAPTPTTIPSEAPTEAPTEGPTEAPSEAPSEAPTAPSTEAPTEPPQGATCDGETLSFMLSFFANVQHIGFLVAQARGYYADEGLTVDIQQGGPNVNVLAAIADGTVDAGQPDFGEVTRAVAEGAPVKAIAQTYQRSFLMHYALTESGIETVADWAGKRVGVIQPGLAPERDTELAVAGLSVKDITEVQQDFGIDEFMSGNLDIGSGVVFFHPAAFELDGTYVWPDDFNIFVPDDHGAPIASQTITANDTAIAEKAGALACFLRASLRGWQDALADPAGVLGDSTEMIDPEGFPPEHQALAIDDVLAIVQPEGTGDEIVLAPDPTRYEESLQLLTDVGYLEAPLTVDQVYDGSIWEAMVAP